MIREINNLDLNSINLLLIKEYEKRVDTIKIPKVILQRIGILSGAKTFAKNN